MTRIPAAYSFDPVQIGRLECDAWVAYYRREWRAFLTSAVALVDAGFRMGRRRTLLGAWHVLRANQLWAPYPDNDPDAARNQMRRFYALVAASGDPGLDPDRAAALEVDWWRVHRTHQHAEQPAGASGAPDDDELTRALAALYSFVYDIPASTVRRAAQLRMAAMNCSDSWVAAGRDPADPLLAEERRLLVASYSALREAIDRRLLPARPKVAQASTGRPPRAMTASGGTTGAAAPGSGVA